MQTGRRRFIKHALAGHRHAGRSRRKHLTATLKDIDGATVFTKRLDAKSSRDGRWD
jgi:hypothetical protein